MKTILFPTDFSDCANRAFAYALQLASKTGANILTIHTFERANLSGLSHLPRTLEEFQETQDLFELEDFQDAIPRLKAIQEAQGLTNVEVRHTLIEGPAVPTIIEQAQKENADLIIMGTTGAGALKAIFLGSVAAEVMENATCPVLAIPENAVFDGQLDHVAFTTSFKDEEVVALELVTKVLSAFQPAIHCVNVDLSHTEAFAHRMDTFAKHFASRSDLTFDIVDGSNFEAALTAFLDQKEVDILAMVTHKRNFFQELFEFSRTKNLVYHTLTPILSIPAGLIK